jgi:YD repeat-containing protein
VPTTVTNPDERRITYTYDVLKRRRTLTDPDDGVFTYARVPLALPVRSCD